MKAKFIYEAFEKKDKETAREDLLFPELANLTPIAKILYMLAEEITISKGRLEKLRATLKLNPKEFTGLVHCMKEAALYGSQDLILVFANDKLVITQDLEGPYGFFIFSHQMKGLKGYGGKIYKSKVEHIMIAAHNDLRKDEFTVIEDDVEVGTKGDAWTQIFYDKETGRRSTQMISEDELDALYIYEDKRYFHGHPKVQKR
jgi:hypothetical protein